MSQRAHGDEPWHSDSSSGLEPLPPQRPRRRVVLTAVVAVVALGLVLTAAAGAWALRQMDPGAPGEEVSVVIPHGSSPHRIAALLDDRGVISDARLFRLYARFRQAGPFQAGNYTFRRNQSFDEALRVLDGGPEVVVQRLTVPEGLTLRQIADRVGRLKGRSADRFLEVARSGTVRSRFQAAGATSLEGYLLPETYEFEPDEDEADILRRMVGAFDAVGAELGLDQSKAKVGLEPHEVVIVASMVEEEAKVEDERGKVSRVIYNRIERRETLGIDATLRYGLNRPTEPLRQSDLASDNPYNTRKFRGLPPTAIASPGRASLEAALNPTPGPWLFYVLIDKDGRHAFATTAAEFARYKAEAKAKGLL